MFLKFITFIEDQHFSPNIVSSHLFSTLMPMLTEEIQSNLEGSLAVFEEKKGQKFTDFNKVRETIESLTDEVCKKDKNIKDIPIVLNVIPI